MLYRFIIMVSTGVYFSRRQPVLQKRTAMLGIGVKWPREIGGAIGFGVGPSQGPEKTVFVPI